MLFPMSLPGHRSEFRARRWNTPGRGWRLLPAHPITGRLVLAWLNLGPLNTARLVNTVRLAAARLVGRVRRVRFADDGMSTAEYAIGTIAAAAFAAVLYAVVTGDSIVTGLTSLVEQALSVEF